MKRLLVFLTLMFLAVDCHAIGTETATTAERVLNDVWNQTRNSLIVSIDASSNISNQALADSWIDNQNALRTVISGDVIMPSGKAIRVSSDTVDSLKDAWVDNQNALRTIVSGDVIMPGGLAIRVSGDVGSNMTALNDSWIDNQNALRMIISGDIIDTTTNTVKVSDGTGSLNTIIDSGTLTSITNTVKISTDPGYTGIYNGRRIVATSGDAIQLITADTVCYKVILTALTNDTGVICVGGSDVDAAVQTRIGIPLVAGQSITLPIDNVNKVWIDSTVSGSVDGVTFIYFR